METNAMAKKGILLAAFLVAAARIIDSYAGWYDDSYYIWTAIAFFGITTLFLLNRKIVNIFLTGVTGLGCLISAEIFLGISGFNRYMDHWFDIYFIGFFSSMAGLVAALLLSHYGITFDHFPRRGEAELTPQRQKGLLTYFLITAISFSYLVLPERAALSVPIFVVLQAVMLWFVIPNRKRLFYLLPVLVFAWNAFASANTMWQIPNLILSVFFYGMMLSDGAWKNGIFSCMEMLTSGVRCFELPFRWIKSSAGKYGKQSLVRRLLLALVITVPILLVLVYLLSQADMVFSESIAVYMERFWQLFRFNTVWKLAAGLLTGAFLTALVYAAAMPKTESLMKKCVSRYADPLLLNIPMGAVLVVYTLFAVIQFRYLFAGQELPYGLTYTEYARKGFFELLLLTGVNILTILLAVRYSRSSMGGRITKAFCAYLCLMTVVLLCSSFYRMWLYCADDGLTRMRLLVLGFLVFEAVGLFFTIWYIVKPDYPIISTYAAIALTYYLLLNIVPIDRLIAREQVDRYLTGQREDAAYVYTLSADAAQEVERLLGTEEEEGAERFFRRQKEQHEEIPLRWQRYNLSIEKCREYLPGDLQ